MQEGELFQTKFERTDNFVIDSILSYKLQEADRLGIETKMDVKVPKDLNVSAYVLTGILTNLLDNAMEACEKVQDKKIKITIKYAKKMLIIRISNTYDGKEKFNSVMGIKTSKKIKNFMVMELKVFVTWSRVLTEILRYIQKRSGLLLMW